jgi:hypothetical protein
MFNVLIFNWLTFIFADIYALQVIQLDLKGFWRWCMLYRTTGLILDLSIVWYVEDKRPQGFGDWICLRPQMDGAG